MKADYPTETPLVSVIIPLYNCISFIDEAIRSILEQTYPHFEIIVIDDGSTDNSRQILERYITSGRITYIYQENSGPARARNTGIQTAKGELLAFLDADDAWLPDKLEKQVAFMLEHPDCGLSYTNKYWIDAEGKRMPQTFHWNYPPYGNIFRPLIKDNYISTTSLVMFHRRVLATTGFFDEAYIVRGSEDYDLWLRIAFYYNIGFVNIPLVKYRYHAGGISRNSQNILKANIYLFEKMLNWIPSNDSKLKKRITKKIFLKHKTLLQLFITQRLMPQARETAQKCIKLNPLKPQGYFYYLLSFCTPFLNFERYLLRLVTNRFLAQ